MTITKGRGTTTYHCYRPEDRNGQKVINIYNYTARHWEPCTGKRTIDGVTHYRTIDGDTFTEFDADPTRHSNTPAEDQYTEIPAESLAEFAQAEPTLLLEWLSSAPQHLKPQLQEKLRSLSSEARLSLKQAAQDRGSSPQPNEESHRATEESSAARANPSRPQLAS